jgi:hypothetical protein
MITRAQMPRQLRNKGGITNVVPRTNYLFGGIKKRIRKLIPNELADVAVKAAPFVAPFSPGIAGLMRGIGRFDQRGSLSDAFKQGLATYSFGKLAGKIPGTEKYFGKGMEGAKALAGDVRTKAGSLFKGKTPGVDSNVPKIPSTEGTGFMKKATEATIDKIPFADKLPQKVKEKILAGTISSGASALYSYFAGEFDDPQQPGETMGEYMARRNARVKQQVRMYMDSYYTPLRNPEYASLTPEQRDNFIDGIVGQTEIEGTTDYGYATGGRVGYQTGGVTMANTLAENIKRNVANQAAVNQMFQAAASKVFPEGNFQQIRASSPTQKDYNIKSTKDLVENLPGGIVRDALAPAAAGVMSLPYDAIQGVTRIKESDIDRAMQTAGMSGPKDIMAEAEGLAYARENPLSSAAERTVGASGPLAERLSQPDIIDVGSDPLAEPVMVADSSLITPEPQNQTFTPDSEGFAAYEGIVPGFKARKRSDGRFEYKAPDGSIYGPDTYTMIAAGNYPDIFDPRANVAKGGMPVGIMKTNKAGVMERDYRDKGGFVPVGIKEKADDVPAMLSKNEFVFTADAVRGAGNGSIEKGAQRMYNTMKNLEKRVV